MGDMTFEEYSSAAKGIELSDYSSLLRLGRRWSRIPDDAPRDVKIGVIGTASLQLVVSVLRVALSRYNLCADVYEGEYDGIVMDVYDDESGLYQFRPSIVIMIPDYRDIRERVPAVLAGEQAVEDAVEAAVAVYMDMFARIHKNLPECQILMSDFVEPVEEPLGVMGANSIYSASLFYRQVNLSLIRSRQPYVTFIDIDKLASNIGKCKWFDETAYYLNKSGFALQYIGLFVDSFARQIKSLCGGIRKCIVLDLDNTLWGGVVGDMGYDGIQLDPNNAEGESYRAFQKYLKCLKERGVLLAVCSKNDYDNAAEVFEKNEYMILKMDDIACFIADWNDKAANVRRIAKKLNIGLDSMVFFDDNPTERELIRELVPEVLVVDVPQDSAYYVRALDEAHCFDWGQLTKEDVGRSQSYRDNEKREELIRCSDNYEDYLKKLQMKAYWAEVDESTLERFTQLTNKSNQFNLRTRRYSDADILTMRSNDEYKLITVSLKDRFSNYGVISCVVLKFDSDTCYIENWVMSCRVLKKTVEQYTMAGILREAEARGVRYIRGEYARSPKNGMVAGLYRELGFHTENESAEGGEYVLDMSSVDDKNYIFYMEDI